MRVWLVIIILGITGAGASAHAQSDDERARAHFEAARSYYEQARYDDAAREFQQAFDLSGRPEMLLNLSQAHERALRYEAAIVAAKRYLELVPAAEDRKTIEDRIQNLQDLKERYEQGGPSPLAPPGSTGAPEDPTSPSAIQPGAQTKPPTAAPPATTPVDTPPTAATPVPVPEASAAPPLATDATSAEAPNRFTVPAIVLMGTGGAALVASLVTGLVAHADYKSLERQCAPNGDCPPSAEDELDSGKSLSVASTVLAIVGIVAAGTGTALLVLGANRTEEPKPATGGQLSLAPGPTPLSAAARLSF